MARRAVTAPAGTRALFLDRDGVINEDTGYVHRVEDFVFLPGIFALCGVARRAGLAIHVVTNQAGIGRGYYTEAQFAALCEWMAARFAERGVPLAAIHHCPDHPEHGVGAYKVDSPRRKPAPGMLLDAAASFNLDLRASVMVGDKATDMVAAGRAAVPTRILVSTDPVEGAGSPPGTLIVPDLAAAASALGRAVLPPGMPPGTGSDPC